MINRKQAGDTIVEVMISLAVISAVIGLAYGIATRSLKQSQQSQERVEASKIAEGQMERLKALSSSTTLSSAIPPQPFCYTTGNLLVTVSGTNCTYNGLYRVSNTYNGNLVTVQIDWDSATGSGTGQDQLIMYYRVY